ncbi:phage scaffolding protein [Fontibacillus sp. BL9]|uniref:phage scaffolding protein n=1 Tax=Fontibacillus sp. BL9 TaxID=3389971 RepID=UPI00397B7869
MDWLKELLKNAGVDESKLDGLIGDVNKELPKHFVPKLQYNEVAEAKKKAEKDVADRDKQLEDLKKSSGNAEELKQQIQKLQEDNKTAAEKYESDLKEMQLGNALKLALAGQVHDADLLTGLIDKTKIELGEDGSIKAGLEDQIKTLRESKGFLFAENKPTFKGANPADPASQTSTSSLSDAATISGIFSQQ